MAKELIIIGSQSGVGRTSIAANLISLMENKVVLDSTTSQNLQRFFKIYSEKIIDFSVDKLAFVELDKCMECGCCIDACKYGAISSDFVVNELLCEGCGACHFKCPQAAIKLEKVNSAKIFEAETSVGKMISALPEIGKNYSTKLLAEIRNIAQGYAKKDNKKLVELGDFSCNKFPTESIVLLVVEPSFSSIQEFKRIIPSLLDWKNRVLVCVNKFNANTELTAEIENICADNSLEIVGKVQYDLSFLKACQVGKTVFDNDETSKIADEILSVYKKIEGILNV